MQPVSSLAASVRTHAQKGLLKGWEKKHRSLQHHPHDTSLLQIFFLPHLSSLFLKYLYDIRAKY